MLDMIHELEKDRERLDARNVDIDWGGWIIMVIFRALVIAGAVVPEGAAMPGGD
jgi:hypothetical protein